MVILLGVSTNAASQVYEPVFQAAALPLPEISKGARDASFADFNRDGRLDVVAISNNTASARVSLGGSDGKLHPVAPIAGFDRVLDLRLGEFDGDGIVDIIFLVGTSILERKPTQFQIARGRGDGSFELGAVQTVVDASFIAWGWAVGDVNGDNVTDIVVFGEGTRAFVYTTGPNGELQAGQDLDRGVAYLTVIEDLDSDGNADVIMAGSADVSHGMLRIFPGHGDGTFEAPRDIPSLAALTHLIVEDLNRDGEQDVVVGTNPKRFGYQMPDNSQIGVYRGRRDGALDSPEIVDLGYGLRYNGSIYGMLFRIERPDHSLRVGDVNEDGLLDICGTGNGFMVMITNRSLKLSAPQQRVGGEANGFLDLVDVNSDGHLDVLLDDTSPDGGAPCYCRVAMGNGPMMLPGRGDGSFGADTRVPLAGKSSAVAVGDVDEDERQDIVVASSERQTVALYLNAGKRAFKQPHYVDVLVIPRFVSFGDVNGDHRLDMLAVGEEAVSISLGRSGLSFESPYLIEVGIPEEGAFLRRSLLGDINADGYDDLAATGADGILMFRGGPGGLETDASLVVEDATLLALADATGDGYLDLVVTKERTVVVFAGHGDRSFAAGDALTAYPAHEAEVGDFDGDGRPDLFLAIYDCGWYGGNCPSTSLLRGRSGGAFTAPESLGIIGRAHTLAEVTGDKTVELITTPGSSDANAGAIVVYQRGIIPTLGRARAFFLLWAAGAESVVADVDGDTRKDIVAIDRIGLQTSADYLSVIWNAGRFAAPDRRESEPMHAKGAASAARAALSPNPVISGGTVRYLFQPSREASEYEVTLYDVGGRRVFSRAGRITGTDLQVAEWEARDFRGQPLASGIYFMRFRSADMVHNHKLVVLR